MPIFQVIDYNNKGIHSMRSSKKPVYSSAPISQVQQLQFSLISAEQIEALSVCEINDPKISDENDVPIKGGPNDLRLGPTNGNQQCLTCGEGPSCQGHFGYIKLEDSVLHYGYLKEIQKILKAVCHNCYKVKRPRDEEQRKKFIMVSRVISPKQRLNMFANLTKNLSICHQLSQQDEKDQVLKRFKGCGYKSNPRKIYLKNYHFYVQESVRDAKKKPKIIGRHLIKHILANLSLYTNQCELLGFIVTKPISLVIQNLLVVPPQVRPSIFMNSQIKCEDDITRTYSKIISLNRRLFIEKGKLTVQQREQIVQDIQHMIATIMFKLDTNSLNRGRIKNLKKKKKIQNFKAITDRLQGKQGRFRQNLMGKRVDFSARTVISPDPNLALDQIGIPVKIANKLTFPELINQLNYEKIVNLCLSGKVKTIIRPPEQCLNNDNKIINMQKIDKSSKEEIEKYLNYGMVAERTLQNGDYVLMNRQPTLHRMSMMAHRVKILPFNTFRLNLSACPPYNADFDGDEMNLHVPQSYETLAELKKISAVPNQIVAPKNNAPVMGIVQDALLGVYLFTLRDCFLTREQIMNLVMWITSTSKQNDHDDITKQIPLPAIIKPEPLWTGKQIISILFPKTLSIILIKDKFQGLANSSDYNVLIRHGELLTGCLQKDLMGSGAGSMIHSIWLEEGPLAANDFITNSQRVINQWMIQNSFTIGASDIVPKKQIQQLIQKEKTNIENLYYQILSKYRNPKRIYQQNLHQKGKKVVDSFEYNVNLHLNSRLSKAQQLIRKTLRFTQNNIYRIIEAKSKGSETNIAQILFSVGNQNVNGQRCPLGFSRRALPHFCKQDHKPQSRGYVHSSFYQGLKPHELFFHSMGGRQGLSDTAVKTSHVGYLQRKLVKCLQDIVVNYDGSVRDSQDNLLQKCYGEDGFISEYLQKQKLIGAEVGKQAFRRKYQWLDTQLFQSFNYQQSELDKVKTQYSILYNYRKRLRSIFIQNRDGTSIQYFCPIKIQRLINKINQQLGGNQLNFQHQYERIGPLQICQGVERLIEQCVPPLTKQLDSYFKYKIRTQIFDDQDSMSEDDQEDLKDINHEQEDYQFIDGPIKKQQPKQIKKEKIKKTKNKNKFSQTNVNSFQQEIGLQIFRIHLRYNLASKILLKKYQISKSCFKELMKQIKMKFHQALASSGESVGSLAAQSIGEPTTQMTLNTFHLAGVSDRNVTLGLPRLQQLLDISVNMKTPSMTVFPKKRIFYHERTSIQNQVYLLEHLTYILPQRKIYDFLESSRLVYTPKKQIIAKQTIKQIDPYWGIIMIFSGKKFSSKKYWLQILDKIQRFVAQINSVYSFIGFMELLEKKQFNDTNDQIENPQLLLKFKESKIQNDRFNQQTLSKEQSPLLKTQKLKNPPIQIKSHLSVANCQIFELLIKIESQVRNLALCGIKNVKSAKTSKKTLFSIPKSHPLYIYTSKNTSSQSLRLKYQLTAFETDGSNLKQCLSHPEVDYRKTYSNNVLEISQILGIEAARQSFLNQLKDILTPYGIYINYRHLTVLVDWICMRGKMTAINRFGLNKAKDVSLIRKASYQQTSKILFDSALFSQRDYLRGISERIMFGQPIRSGSNSFKLLVDLNKVGQYVSKADFDKNNIIQQHKFGYEQGSLFYCNKTPQIKSPFNDSVTRSNFSLSYHNNSLHQEGLFSPNTQFSRYSPLLQSKLSPSYMQSPRNSLNLTQLKNKNSKLNMSSLSNFNFKGNSTMSPSYLHEQMSSIGMNSSVYSSSSPGYGYGGNKSSKTQNSSISQNQSINSVKYGSQSPKYNHQIIKKSVSKVQEDNDEEDMEQF